MLSPTHFSWSTLLFVRMTVLGSCGAWPAAGLACSGFLVEHDNFKLLVDAGYAILPKLLETTSAESIDAVLISHGHPDHCADLNPLLRARALADRPPEALPIHTMAGAIDSVLALDRPGMLDEAYGVRVFTAGDRFDSGPFAVQTFDLPHFVPNVGVRLTAAGRTIAYTGDSGPSASLADLAKGADLFSPKQRLRTRRLLTRGSSSQLPSKLVRLRPPPGFSISP